MRATQNSIIIAISWTPATLILLQQQPLSETKPRKRTPQVELPQLKAPQSNWSPHLGTLFTTFICFYLHLIGYMVVGFGGQSRYPGEMENLVRTLTAA